MTQRDKLVLLLYRVRGFLGSVENFVGRPNILPFQMAVDNITTVILALEELKEWPS